MNTTYKSQQALAAQLIRKDLKAAYPGIKFIVTSQGYSMGDHVNVSWTDGPMRDDVRDLVCKYQQGEFNGMEDIYEYSNSIDDLPQTKYLFCDRNRSPELEERLTALFNEKYEFNYTVGQLFRGESAPYNEDWKEWPNCIMHRVANELEAEL